MKKNHRYNLLMCYALSFLFISTNISAQNVHYGDNFVIDKQQTGNQTYIANQYVKMISGASYKPGKDFFGIRNTEFDAKINPSSVVDTKTNLDQNLADVTNSQLNKTLPVGRSPILIDVSPSGSATAQLPIEVPPGTNGLAPALALAYNSLTGMGIMGMGWDLSGLSAITRTGKTFYHDGHPSNVALNNEDVFMFNGQRLLSEPYSQNSYGLDQASYRTESDIFTLFVSVGTAGNGPSYFYGITKEGMYLEFGRTDDSRIEAQGSTTVLYWALNKIRDHSGNEINILYHEDNNTGESWPTDIVYAGGINKIHFSYNSFNDNQVAYVAGSTVRNNSLLNQISTYTNGNLLKRYQFTYKNDFYPHLSAIVERGYDGSVYNSTIINWDNKSSNSLLKKSLKFNYDKGLEYIFGDYNGDGKTDVVTYPKSLNNPSANYWKLYESNGSDLIYVNQGPLNQDFRKIAGGFYIDWHMIQGSDFNSDGKTDLVFQGINTQGTTADNAMYYAVYLANADGLGFTLDPAYTNNYKVNQQVRWGDFDGDGKVDYMLYDITYDSQTKKHKLNWLISIKNLPGFQGSFEVSDEKCQVFCPDLQRNGISDIAVMSTDGITAAYELAIASDLTGSLKSICPDGQNCNFNYGSQNVTYNGDYNGDGLGDNLYFNKTSNKWELYHFDGKKLVWPVNNSAHQPINILPVDTSFKNSSNFNYWPADYNGDGKTDLLEIVATGTKIPNSNQAFYTKNFNIYYSDGLSFQKESFNLSEASYLNEPQKNLYVAVDINGDGQSDFLELNPNNTSVSLYEFHPFENKHKVSSIIDGFRKKTSFVYKPLTDGTVYSKDLNNSSFPIMDFQAPIYVVQAINRDNGIGGIMSTYFSYSGAKIHLQGKGFLGFTQTTSTDFNYQNQIQTITSNKFEVSPKFYYLQPVSTKKTFYNRQYRFGGTIATINYTNDLIDYTPSPGGGGGGDGTTASATIPGGGNDVNPANKRFFPFIKETETIDHLTGTTVTAHSDYDINGNVYNQLINYNGEATKKTVTNYLSAGSWISVRPEYVTVTQTRPNEPDDVRKVKHIYDSQTGYLQKRITDPDLPGKVTTEYTYNNFGNLIQSKITADGLHTIINSSEFDNLGRFSLNAKNALNQTDYIREYDSKNGNVLNSMDANGLKTYYSYDAFGRQMTMLNPTGNQVSTTLHWADASSPQYCVYYTTVQSSGTDPLTTYYDILGRKIREQYNSFEGKPIYIDTKYNINGQVASVSKPYSPGETIQSTFYKYDFFGRIQNEINPVCTLSYTYSGTTMTITNSVSGQKKIKKLDGTGQVKESSDDIATVYYNYYSSGAVKSITTPGGNVTTMTYDAYGRQQTLQDPDAGTTIYTYNAYGQLKYQKDALNNETNLTYDALGRVLTKTTAEGLYSWEYDTQSKGIGMLSSVKSPGGFETAYQYDDFSRVNKVTEKNGSDYLQTQYEYDALGRETKHTYPSGFAVAKTYNSNGYMNQVSLPGSQTIIWNGVSQNSQGQWTQYAYGNKQTILKMYDSNNFLTAYTVASPGSSGAVFNMGYSFQAATGNLLSRQDITRNLTESFTYDAVDRLKSFSGPVTGNIQYASNGNVLSKSGAGTYHYNSNNPHAVATVSNYSNIPSFTENLIYTSFHKVSSIEDSDAVVKKLLLSYGPEEQRRITKYYENNSLQKTKIFSIDYEKQIAGSSTKEIHYIAGGDGLAAVYIIENGIASLYYIHKDHLGSIQLICDENGLKKEEYSFDAWGRRRNPNDWTYNAIPAATILDRGYTGHEHLDVFGLINMNGRVYDPVLGRMLSPDNYVQAFDFSQNFNRYSYCWNNPLKYTDPSGDFIFTLAAIIAAPFTGGASLALLPYTIGADIGCWQGGSLANGTMNPFKWDYSSGKTWGYMAGGALVGAASGGAANAVATSGMVGANTAAIMTGSLINSVGTFAYTGGQTDISVSFGFGSYNFSTGEFGYLGKAGNKWYENVGYGLGALANAADILAGLHPGDVELRTENTSSPGNKDVIGHSQLVDANGDPVVDWGPGEQLYKDDPFRSVPGTNMYENCNPLSADKMKWDPVNISGVNTGRISGWNPTGNYNLGLNSCVSQTSRALNASGVFNVGIHPYLLYGQMYLRSLGVRPALYSYFLTH